MESIERKDENIWTKMIFSLYCVSIFCLIYTSWKNLSRRNKRTIQSIIFYSFKGKPLFIFWEIRICWSIEKIPQIHASTKITDVLFMVVVMERRIWDKEKNSCGTPREVISPMSFCTDVNLPDLPKEEHKAMSSRTKEDKRNSRRN